MFKKLSESELGALRESINLYMTEHPTTQLKVAEEIDIMPFTLRRFMSGKYPVHSITVAKVICFLKSKGYNWHPDRKDS